MPPPKKDTDTIRREVALYASLGGKSYRVQKTDTIVHFIHLGQIDRYFTETLSMPLLINTKYDMFLVNSYYDLYNQEDGTSRTSTVDEALEIYVQEYIETGFISEDGLVTENDL